MHRWAYQEIGEIPGVGMGGRDWKFKWWCAWVYSDIYQTWQDRDRRDGRKSGVKPISTQSLGFQETVAEVAQRDDDEGLLRTGLEWGEVGYGENMAEKVS